MQTTVINGVTVTADEALTTEEITTLVEEEITLWNQRKKALGGIEITLDGEEIVLSASEKSPIRRVRRITGYLSNIENFNEAKLAECCSRTVHMSK